MGVVGSFRIGVCLTDDHERTALHGVLHSVQVGHAHQGIGGCHPPQIELALFHGLHLLPGTQSWCCSNGVFGESPGLLHLCSVVRVGHHPVSRKQMGQPSGFTAAHGIGLTGE